MDDDFFMDYANSAARRLDLAIRKEILIETNIFINPKSVRVYVRMKS